MSEILQRMSSMSFEWILLFTHLSSSPWAMGNNIILTTESHEPIISMASGCNSVCVRAVHSDPVMATELPRVNLFALQNITFTSVWILC